jgi:hypothetical protein
MNKLEGFPTIYCASLEESTDRREKLNAQFDQLPPDWEAVQMCVIRDMFGEIKLRERQLDDWAVTAYIIKRDYAKKIIDHCIIQLRDIIENLPPYWGEATAYRLEINNWIQLQPLVEHLILLNRGKVYVYPILVEDVTGPTTSNIPQAENHIVSTNFVKSWWENQNIKYNQ